MHSLDIIIARNRKAVIRAWQETLDDEYALSVEDANPDIFKTHDCDVHPEASEQEG